MTTKTLESLASFIERNRLTMTAERTDRNPHMENSRDMRHWRCYIHNGQRHMTLIFSMGSALTGKPELTSVLDCLASDAAGYLQADNFEDWCGSYGYDTDSRKAERTYKAIERQALALKRLLGQAEFESLLWETERL